MRISLKKYVILVRKQKVGESLMKIAVDAMGGDNAHKQLLKGLC